MALIGLDIGTTGCKAHIFDDELNFMASANREYSVAIPHPGWAEQDAENVWMLAKDCLREGVIKTGVQDSVKAISLSVQGEAVVPVDKYGTALRPMILGMDTRTDAQNQILKDQFGARELFIKTGMPVHTTNTLPKLMWMKENEPVLWRDAHKFLLYEDFIINKITGKAVISQCLASRTQVFNLEKKFWSEEILEFLGLKKERLAEVMVSGSPVGQMKADLADEIGIRTRPLIGCGGHDQACGALGAGLTQPGLAMVSTGTAEVVEVSMDIPHLNEILFKSNVSVYLHTFPKLFVAMTLNQSGAFILRWFRDTFCQSELELAQKTGNDPYDLLLKNVGPDPSPVMLLPHFAGSGTPFFDTQSKGALVGLTFATTKKDIAKAILDGLTLELRINLEILNHGGINISELRAIGGGAKSELWLQLKADITGIPVAVPEMTEAAGMGAAILAGVASGLFQTTASAIDSHIKIKKVYQPNLETKKLFDERHCVYQELYPALIDINHKL